MQVTRVQQVDNDTYLISADGKSGLVMPLDLVDKEILAGFDRSGTCRVNKKDATIRVSKIGSARVQILLPIEYDFIQKLNLEKNSPEKGINLSIDKDQVNPGTFGRFFLLRKRGIENLYNRPENSFTPLPRGASVIRINDKGFAACKIGTQWGIYDLSNRKQILKGAYQEIRWSAPFFRILYNGKCGLASADGKILLAPVYDGLYGIGSERAVVFREKGKYGLITTGGNILLESIYTNCRRVREIEALYLKNSERWGIYTYSGEEILSPQLELFDPFPPMTHLFSSRELGEVYRIDDQFIVLGKLTEGKRTPSSEYLIKLDRKFIVVDSQGRISGKLDFENVDFLMWNLFAVSANGKWGVVQADGEMVLDTIYESVSECGKNAVKVFDGKAYGLYVYSSGNLIQPKYVQIESISSYFFSFQINNKWGAIDNDGNEILPPRYDKVTFYNNGQFRVRLNGKRGSVKLGENIFIPEGKPAPEPGSGNNTTESEYVFEPGPSELKWDWSSY